jgi:hypothetical protein
MKKTLHTLYNNMKCSNCQKPVEKTRHKSDVKKNKTGNVFCNRSCAATYNNKIPKRKLKNQCPVCLKKIATRTKYCKDCYVKKHFLGDKTLAEATADRKDANRYCSIRQGARKAYLKSDKPQCCVECGYSLHFEVCHIVDIANHPLDTLIREINDLSNLVALCRNHHWEFDKGHLKLK